MLAGDSCNFPTISSLWQCVVFLRAHGITYRRVHHQRLGVLVALSSLLTQYDRRNRRSSAFWKRRSFRWTRLRLERHFYAATAPAASRDFTTCNVRRLTLAFISGLQHQQTPRKQKWWAGTCRGFSEVPQKTEEDGVERIQKASIEEMTGFSEINRVPLASKKLSLSFPTKKDP